MCSRRPDAHGLRGVRYDWLLASRKSSSIATLIPVRLPDEAKCSSLPRRAAPSVTRLDINFLLVPRTSVGLSGLHTGALYLWYHHYEKVFWRLVGVTAQWSRAYIAFPEDLGSVLGTHSGL